MFARHRDFFLRIVAEFARSPWCVVLATGHLPVAALGVLPDNIVAYQWIPQLRVLRHADVFLTHGGMNSVQEATVSGVPMLLAPRVREQRLTARRVVSLSLGARMSRTKSLRDQVEWLSEGALADRRVCDACALSTPARAAWVDRPTLSGLRLGYVQLAALRTAAAWPAVSMVRVQRHFI